MRTLSSMFLVTVVALVTSCSNSPQNGTADGGRLFDELQVKDGGVTLRDLAFDGAVLDTLTTDHVRLSPAADGGRVTLRLLPDRAAATEGAKSSLGSRLTYVYVSAAFVDVQQIGHSHLRMEFSDAAARGANGAIMNADRLAISFDY